MRFSEVGFCDSMMYYAYTQNDDVVCVTGKNNGLHRSTWINSPSELGI